MKYLVRKRPGGRAHLLGQNGDTLCTMLSTGGIDRAAYEIIEANEPPKPVCFMCDGRLRRLQQLAATRMSNQFRQ